MGKYIGLGIVILLVILAGAGLWQMSQNEESETASVEVIDTVEADQEGSTPDEAGDADEDVAQDGEQMEIEETEELEVVTLSLDVVAQHSNGNDCWMIIEGGVYDVTDYVSQHPGGEAILEGCGKDATELFATKNLGADAHPHSQTARAQLETFLLGSLGDSI